MLRAFKTSLAPNHLSDYHFESNWMNGWMDEWMDGWKDGWMDLPSHPLVTETMVMKS